jgi:SsrA-binding protein
MSTKSSKSTTKTSDSRIADNKKALFNYAIEERF